MTSEITTTPDGTRWFVASEADGRIAKVDWLDPELFQAPKPKEPEDFDF